MEAKLAEYRERKIKEQHIKENAFRGFFGLFRRATPESGRIINPLKAATVWKKKKKKKVLQKGKRLQVCHGAVVSSVNKPTKEITITNITHETQRRLASKLRLGTNDSKTKEDESKTTISASTEQENQDSDNISVCDTDEHTESPPQKFSKLLFVLKIAMWFTVWLIFIELQFGAVFFVISALVFVFINTRTGKRKQNGTLSAYSVFNPNCERLQGTITAEQFEAELLYRKPQATT